MKMSVKLIIAIVVIAVLGGGLFVLTSKKGTDVQDTPEAQDIQESTEAQEAGVAPASELDRWVGEAGVFNMIFEFTHVNIDLPDESNWCETRDWKLTDLKKCLNDTQNSTKDGGWCPVFFENHDMSRSINC